MAISIDTVYQRVLALANKEQRGYITPQEFNLFANQAQQEIFEQYFYDLNKASKDLGNETFYSDVDDMLEQKMQLFENVDGINLISGYTGAGNSNIKKLPDYVYRVHRIEYNNVNCEILSTKDFNDCRSGGYLTKPSKSRPVVNIRNNTIRCIGQWNFEVMPTGIFYFRRPEIVQWGYFVVNDKALHDSSTNKTTNFELHPSEETELVYKILKFAGLSMRRDDVVRSAQSLEAMQSQQEKL